MKYTVRIPHRVVYSIGDAHGRGREVIETIQRLEFRSMLRGESHPAFVQLGDLCDGFAMPPNATDDDLRATVHAKIDEMPDLAAVLHRDGNLFVDWRRDEGVRAKLSGHELLNTTDHDILVALFQAVRCFETLKLFCLFQKSHEFYVTFGNHDGDLLRGGCAYGRQQKYILLGLLGLSPDAVIAHMTEGRTRRVLRNPWLNWLYHCPHIVMSADTVYMHGGPTGAISERLAREGSDGFTTWIDELDSARRNGLRDIAFAEHECFLSPDGAPNDWTLRPDRISDFLHAAGRKYLAVGHSPFLDYEKGPKLDLEHATDEMRHHFTTPGQLAPEGRLIKQDTDMKRTGGLWVCRHEVGTDTWTAFDADLHETPLRRG